jgi:lysophospholipase L1-like esterase
MSVLSRVTRVVTPAVLALAAVAAWHSVTTSAPTTTPYAAGPVAHAGTGWVDTWTAMPQLTEPGNMPPAPYTGPEGVLTDTTLRQTLRLTTGGDRIRVAVSNEFGGAPLPVTRVAVARPAGGQVGTSAIQPGTSQRVTFSGSPAVTIPIGARYVSDPVRLPVRPGDTLSVTMYLATGQASQSITSHPGSRTTTYLLRGDHVEATHLPGSTPVDHWYFLSSVEARESATATVVLGDSLTDGRGSTTNGNDRWTDQLVDRLRAAHINDVSVLNEAAGGNRVLQDGLGPSLVSREDRDVFGRSGADRVILFEGVNDIGTADATAAAQHEVTRQLITALDQLTTRVHAHGMRIYGATITPFGNNEMYDDPAGLREASRETVNHWIRTSGAFDAVLDFDRAVRDPGHPDQLIEALSDGDWLHLNPSGYARLAATVPLRLLR